MKKSKVAKVESDFARTPASSMAAKEHEKSESDLEREGEMDLDDLLRVEKIRSDPERMKRVHAAAEKKQVHIRSIQDLKMAGEALAHKNRFPKREK
jgi:hypothetical protein